MSDGFGDDLWARHEVTADAVLVRIGGVIDYATNDFFVEHLRAAEQAATPSVPIVLDLTDVDFLGSSGLAALVAHQQRCANLGSPLRVIATQRAVVRPITITGLSDTIRLVATRQQAIALHEPASPEQ